MKTIVTILTLIIALSSCKEKKKQGDFTLKLESSFNESGNYVDKSQSRFANFFEVNTNSIKITFTSIALNNETILERNGDDFTGIIPKYEDFTTNNGVTYTFQDIELNGKVFESGSDYYLEGIQKYTVTNTSNGNVFIVEGTFKFNRN